MHGVPILRTLLSYLSDMHVDIFYVLIILLCAHGLRSMSGVRRTRIPSCSGSFFRGSGPCCGCRVSSAVGAQDRVLFVIGAPLLMSGTQIASATENDRHVEVFGIASGSLHNAAGNRFPETKPMRLPLENTSSSSCDRFFSADRERWDCHMSSGMHVSSASRLKLDIFRST